jgi:hypothetical protein
MPDEGVLRDKARQAVEQRKVPNRSPDRLWGGPGVGAPCAVCDRPVEKAEMEFEIQFARDGSTTPYFDVFHVHTRCYALWEFVRRSEAGSRE